MFGPKAIYSTRDLYVVTKTMCVIFMKQTIKEGVSRSNKTTYIRLRLSYDTRKVSWKDLKDLGET